MNISERWHDLLAASRPGPVQRIARAGLRVIGAAYGLGVSANLWVFDSRVLNRKALACPVISVGNITLGGTGKTSACALLARGLLKRGLVPAIILRGHRRQGRSPLLVSDGEDVLAGPDEAGDEAHMLGTLVPGAVVAVGKWREAVGRMALRETGAEVIILDDGLQYFRLKRDLDIVLLDALRPLTADSQLFPGGTLREPLQQLRRADLLLFTHTDVADPNDLGALKALAAAAAPGVPFVHAAHRPTTLRPASGSGDERPPAFLEGKRVAALSGIGTPEAFELTIERLGAAEVVPLRYPDHHRYSSRDAERILRAASSADLIVTTEKDAVRLPEAIRQSKRVYVLRVEMSITSGDDALQAALDEAIAGRS